MHPRRIPILRPRLGAHPYTLVTRPRRPAPRRPRGLATLASRLLTLVAAAVVPVAVHAQDAPSLVPTVASVQEAEPVPFRPAPGTDLSHVRGVGVVAAPALSVAWFGAQDGLLWVSFRLAGDRSVDAERLIVSTSDGSVHDVFVGSITVRPAADPDAPLVAIAEVVAGASAPSTRTAAWLFQNRSDEPTRVGAIAYAPTRVARDVVLARTFGGPDPRDAFDAWLQKVEEVVSRAATAIGDGSPAEIEAALLDAFPADLRRGDGAGMVDGIELAPGAAIGLVLTPASFTDHVGDATLFIDPAITSLSADGLRRVAFSAGPTVGPNLP